MLTLEVVRASSEDLILSFYVPVATGHGWAPHVKGVGRKSPVGHTSDVRAVLSDQRTDCWTTATITKSGHCRRWQETWKSCKTRAPYLMTAGPGAPYAWRVQRRVPNVRQRHIISIDSPEEKKNKRCRADNQRQPPGNLSNYPIKSSVSMLRIKSHSWIFMTGNRYKVKLSSS